MVRHLRILSFLVGAIALLPSLVWADAWDPPPTYYSGATGTGATLKSQLTSAMSLGHIQREYGEFKLISPIVDQDPNNPDNVLLVYNRASVQGEWSFGGTIWNREHVWPQSLQPGSVEEDSTGNLGDPHALRPCNPDINNSRGNKAFGFETNTGSYVSINTEYYFPGDADKGDIARQLFYSATRYASSGLTLVDTVPSGNQMGDLSSLIAWHFLDVPDEFERRRNHTIFSSDYNPLFTNNRNAYIDHPEFVWSVYMDQFNDSQITIDGGTVDGSGGSTLDLDFGRVFVGGAVPAAQNFTLNKGGQNGTYYEVNVAGQATSSVTGRFNAFRTNGTDSTSIDVGLDTSTATAGLKSGTVTVDNLDVTTEFGVGHGAQDGNDVFNVGLEVLDHAMASFDGSTQVTSLMHNFGAVDMGAANPTFDFDLFNLEVTLGYTAALDFDSLMASGDTGILSSDLAAAAGSLSLDAGLDQGFTVSFDTSSLGNFSATYTLMVSDEDLPGALSELLTLTVLGQIVTPGTLPGDYNGDGIVDAADYSVWRDAKEAGEMTLLNRNEANSGPVGEADYEYWRANFGIFAAGGAASAVPSSLSAGSAGAYHAVPEPATGVLLGIGVLVLLVAGRRFDLRRPES